MPPVIFTFYGTVDICNIICVYRKFCKTKTRFVFELLERGEKRKGAFMGTHTQLVDIKSKLNHKIKLPDEALLFIFCNFIF